MIIFRFWTNRTAQSVKTTRAAGWRQRCVCRRGPVGTLTGRAGPVSVRKQLLVLDHRTAVCCCGCCAAVSAPPVGRGGAALIIMTEPALFRCASDRKLVNRVVWTRHETGSGRKAEEEANKTADFCFLSLMLQDLFRRHVTPPINELTPPLPKGSGSDEATWPGTDTGSHCLCHLVVKSWRCDQNLNPQMSDQSLLMITQMIDPVCAPSPAASFLAFAISWRFSSLIKFPFEVFVLTSAKHVSKLTFCYVEKLGLNRCHTAALELS